jgi:hypothetical protein
MVDLHQQIGNSTIGAIDRLATRLLTCDSDAARKQLRLLPLNFPFFVQNDLALLLMQSRINKY